MTVRREEGDGEVEEEGERRGGTAGEIGETRKAGEVGRTEAETIAGRTPSEEVSYHQALYLHYLGSV
jgi:hypothetical protein